MLSVAIFMACAYIVLLGYHVELLQDSTCAFFIMAQLQKTSNFRELDVF